MARTPVSSRLPAARLVLAAAAAACLLPALARAAEPAASQDAGAQPAWDARFFRDDLLFLRVEDEVTVSLENGRPRVTSPSKDSATELVQQTTGATWRRAYPLDADLLAGYLATAEAALGRDLPDPNRCYDLQLPAGVDGFALARSLAAIPGVALCLPAPRPVPPPLPPDFESIQDALLPAPEGFDSTDLWSWPGGDGAGVIVVDLEYSWNLSHEDMAPIALVGPTPNDPFNDTNHGASVMGIIGGLRNGWGTTGLAPASILRASPTVTGSFIPEWDVGAAIGRAMSVSSRGDVILLEQQFAGPNAGEQGQDGLVPIEWYEPWYDMVVLAVGNGRIVVEAAGNGGENLDDPIYATGNGGHWPFTAENDSGALMIGAGASPFSQDVDRSRLEFSNYGSRVNIQAHGDWIVTTGYGDLYVAEGPSLFYTGAFGGTSGASAIAAALCAQLQGVHEAGAGAPLTPAAMRTALLATGSPQTSGGNPAGEQIGPRPNLRAALESIFGADDCDASGVPDAIEIGAGLLADSDGDGIPDACQPCPCELAGHPDSREVFDLLAYLDLWFVDDQAAERDGAAGIDVFDLLSFLDCWFPASAGAPCP